MRVVVTATDFADVAIEAAILEDAGFEVIVTEARSPDEIVAAARDAEILLVQLARIDGDTIDALEEGGTPVHLALLVDSGSAATLMRSERAASPG